MIPSIDMINLLLGRIINVLADLGYLGVFLSSMGILPTEVVITVFSATPQANIWMIALISSLGASIGGLPAYFLGYIFNEDVLYGWLNGKGKFLRINTDNIEKGKVNAAKNSFVYVYLTRLVPWLRIVASIAAGYIRVNVFQYTLAVFLGTFTYAIILSYIGSRAGNNWEVISSFIGNIEKGVIIILGLITAFYLLFTWKKRRKSSKKN